jgi:hypothetical protein
MPTSAALPTTITPHIRARRQTRRDKPHPAQRHASVIATYSASFFCTLTSPLSGHQVSRADCRRAGFRAIPNAWSPGSHEEPSRHPPAPSLSTALTRPSKPNTQRQTAREQILLVVTSRKPEYHTGDDSLSAPITLTEELPDCPASTGCCRRAGSCTTTVACMTHEWQNAAV